MSVKKDNINDRESRDEKTNDIRNQILDSVVNNEGKKGPARTSEEPLSHVPGHLGYNKRENLVNANVTENLEEL